VNQTQKQHAVAIELLQQLGLDNITLERQNGHYRYSAWSVPIAERNGSPKTVKRGKIRVPA
jgi:hypothetical protein